MKTLILIPLVFVVSGCASTSSNQYCETPVRDLTQDWHSRTYWCLPKGYVPLIEKQVAAPTTIPSISIVEKSSKPEPLVLYTEHESLQHKVRVISEQRTISNRTASTKPILTTQQTKAANEFFEAINQGANLTKKDQKEILNNTLVVGRKKVAPPIGTEPASKKATISVEVIKPSNEPVKSSSSITLFDVSFTRHNLDTDFSKSDLAKIVGTVSKTDVIKLQGCRQDSEIEGLVLGRALAVRKALIRQGMENKIVILSNQSCTTDKKVKVNV